MSLACHDPDFNLVEGSHQMASTLRIGSFQITESSQDSYQWWPESTNIEGDVSTFFVKEYPKNFQFSLKKKLVSTIPAELRCETRNSCLA